MASRHERATGRRSSGATVVSYRISSRVRGESRAQDFPADERESGAARPRLSRQSNLCTYPAAALAKAKTLETLRIISAIDAREALSPGSAAFSRYVAVGCSNVCYTQHV